MAHAFRPGRLSAADAQALTDMARRLDGAANLKPVPPLYIARQGYDGQPVLYFDATSVTSGELTTSNSDGTDSGPTTDLRFDQSTGVQKTADDPSAGIDTVSLLAATTVQMGAVTITSQGWSGSKTVVTAGSEDHFAVSRPRGSSPVSYSDEIEISNAGTGTDNLRVVANRVAYSGSSGPILWGSTVNLIFHPENGAGYVMLGMAAGSNPVGAAAPYGAVDVAGAPRLGIYHNFASGEYPVVVGGLVVGVWGGTGSLPPVPPPPVPPTPPPSPPPEGYGSIVGSAYFTDTFLPVTGRTVTLTGATSASTSTDGSGGYSFLWVNPGSNTVTLTPVLGETCSTSADGGAGSSGFAGTVTVGAGEVHSVGYLVTPFGPPPPGP